MIIANGEVINLWQSKICKIRFTISNFIQLKHALKLKGIILFHLAIPWATSIFQKYFYKRKL